MSGENMREPWRPDLFTWYMAASAVVISAWAFAPWSGNRLKPTLGVTHSSWPCTSTGALTVSTSLRATSAASSISGTWRSSTTNSSPPSRETVSSERIAPRSRSATARSSSSP